MKFKEYLVEGPATKAKIDKWAKLYFDNTSSVVGEHLWIEKGGKLATSFQHDFALSVREKDVVFDPPMEKSWWGSVTKFGFYRYWKTKEASNIINDFEKIPDCKNLVLCATTINSFNGINDMSKLEEIYFGEGSHVKCGLLRLLKIKNLNKIGMNIKDDDKLKEALTIVQKHWKTKDIPECQQELIEEGYEEYAKL